MEDHIIETDAFSKLQGYVFLPLEIKLIKDETIDKLCLAHKNEKNGTRVDIKNDAINCADLLHETVTSFNIDNENFILKNKDER